MQEHKAVILYKKDITNHNHIIKLSESELPTVKHYFNHVLLSLKKSSGTLILLSSKTEPIDVLLLINLIIRLLLRNYYESL